MADAAASKAAVRKGVRVRVPLRAPVPAAADAPGGRPRRTPAGAPSAAPALQLPSDAVPELTIASFNTHSGIDGWGRPFDLVASCRALEADVLVLEEVFAPREAVSQADEIAAELGYECHELPLARSWRRLDPRSAGKGWEPRKYLAHGHKALYVGGSLSGAGRRDLGGYEEGTWGIAVLTRLPALASEAVELGKLRWDFTRRAALKVELGALPASAQGQPEPRHLTVVGTHVAHFSHGSLLHFSRLRRRLPRTTSPAVLAGDMNLWGPPVSVLMPGWRRAVRGRTWPAGRPHSQLDHIFVTREVEVLEGEVVRSGNSDHLAVRARLSWC